MHTQLSGTTTVSSSKETSSSGGGLRTWARFTSTSPVPHHPLCSWVCVCAREALCNWIMTEIICTEAALRIFSFTKDDAFLFLLWSVARTVSHLRLCVRILSSHNCERSKEHPTRRGSSSSDRKRIEQIKVSESASTELKTSSEPTGFGFFKQLFYRTKRCFLNSFVRIVSVGSWSVPKARTWFSLSPSV